MNQIEELRLEVREELAAYKEELDEYEHTLKAVDKTLSDSTLDKTESTQRLTVEEQDSPDTAPAGAD